MEIQELVGGMSVERIWAKIQGEGNENDFNSDSLQTKQLA